MMGGFWQGIMAVSFPILALGLTMGCSSEELETAKADLKTCREKQHSLKQEADSCRQELAGLTERWNNIQETLASVMPPDLEERKQVIVAKLPQAVREDVQKELDQYFGAVAREIQHLQRKNDEMLQELRSTGRQVDSTRKQVASTSKQVEEVKTVADKIEVGVQAVGQCAEQREQIQERNRQISSQVKQTIDTILAFDKEQINCKGCESRIMMWPKGKERILKFHSSLVSDLTTFQTTLTEEAPPAP